MKKQKKKIPTITSFQATSGSLLSFNHQIEHCITCAIDSAVMDTFQEKVLWHLYNSRKARFADFALDLTKLGNLSSVCAG
jgi:hypothetical protein